MYNKEKVVMLNDAKPKTFRTACNLAHVSARSWTFGSALDELSKAFMLGLMKRMVNGIGKAAKIVTAKTLGL
jgi:hypothetical protein